VLLLQGVSFYRLSPSLFHFLSFLVEALPTVVSCLLLPRLSIQARLPYVLYHTSLANKFYSIKHSPWHQHGYSVSKGLSK
jgi:hypothetical protein